MRELTTWVSFKLYGGNRTEASYLMVTRTEVNVMGTRNEAKS